MLTIVCFGDFRVNKISISFLQQLDLKNKNKTIVQLYRFGFNGFNLDTEERVYDTRNCPGLLPRKDVCRQIKLGLKKPQISRVRLYFINKIMQPVNK